jgi:hypothetical protein
MKFSGLEARNTGIKGKDKLNDFFPSVSLLPFEPKKCRKTLT